jgi:hypothetical protein
VSPRKPHDCPKTQLANLCNQTKAIVRKQLVVHQTRLNFVRQRKKEQTPVPIMISPKTPYARNLERDKPKWSVEQEQEQEQAKKYTQSQDH